MWREVSMHGYFLRTRHCFRPFWRLIHSYFSLPWLSLSIPFAPSPISTPNPLISNFSTVPQDFALCTRQSQTPFKHFSLIHVARTSSTRCSSGSACSLPFVARSSMERPSASWSPRRTILNRCLSTCSALCPILSDLAGQWGQTSRPSWRDARGILGDTCHSAV